MQELGRKRGGGRIFEGGVLAGHYGMSGTLNGTISCRLYNVLYVLAYIIQIGFFFLHIMYAILGAGARGPGEIHST